MQNSQDMKKMGCLGCIFGLFAAPFVAIAELVKDYGGFRKR